MFSSIQFDATSAFSGGGFMPSQSQLAVSNPSAARVSFYSSIMSSESSSTIVASVLSPLTVKLISEASQSGDDKSNFVVNGSEVTNVTLVGIVFSKEERASDVTFTLDDGTGRIVCKRWASEVFDTKEIEAVEDGMYVRLNGHLKSFQGKKQLVAFSVSSIFLVATSYEANQFLEELCDFQMLGMYDAFRTLAGKLRPVVFGAVFGALFGAVFGVLFWMQGNLNMRYGFRFQT
ncbi:replication protein A 32 kDa subunit A-like [Pistacia vera]|uniref:replication protein A 32 kDa subunit A-like n=1 Tax=Pistacia vera TaxID=55513 RepID=UPI001262CF9E|nr:replication protein A 32 kDa subunit A-like [Pistacia vera]